MASYNANNDNNTNNNKASEDTIVVASNRARTIDSPMDQGDKCPMLVLHLNARQRRRAERAATFLDLAADRLRAHWDNLSQHYAEKTPYLGQILARGRRAIREFNMIEHPGEKARNLFVRAERDFEWMSRLLQGSFQIRLERLLKDKLKKDDLTESERASTLASLKKVRRALRPGASLKD